MPYPSPTTYPSASTYPGVPGGPAPATPVGLVEINGVATTGTEVGTVYAGVEIGTVSMPLVEVN